jgi:hypothetical protein
MVGYFTLETAITFHFNKLSSRDSSSPIQSNLANHKPSCATF